MKKTYWWRALVLLIGLLFLGYGYLAVGDYIFYYNAYVDPIMFIALSLLLISPALFFIKDNIFKKWLKFAVIWIILTAIFVSLSPEYSGGYIGLNPTKESVSIWMGVFFVILSLVKIFWDSKKQTKIDN